LLTAASLVRCRTRLVGKPYLTLGHQWGMAWTRRRKFRVAILVGVCAVAAIVISLVLWVPIMEEQSGYTMVGSTLYTYETVYPFGSAMSNFTYRGVQFDFHAPVTCLQNPGGGNLCALVTQSNGVTFWFNLTFGPPCESIWGGLWHTWISPNQQEGVEIRECDSSMPFHLLVAA
jgi:hypothetical protein